MRQVNRVVFSLLLQILTGCVSSVSEFGLTEENTTCHELVEVCFNVSQINSLKSAIAPVEDAIYDMNLYAYSGGKLAAAEYYCRDINPSLKLLCGTSYNLYAIANVGQYEPPIDESQFRAECQFGISRVHDIRELLPMAWMHEDLIVRNPYERINIGFERLVGKVVFSVDKSALKGLEINYIRMRQSPRTVWPFKYENGSRAVDKSEVFDCDYATSVDLDIINSGGQVYFYVLENCQGCLLEGNTDPWAKVPENIQKEAELCTYLEIGATFKKGFFYSGNVKYRLYLGQDSVADFNIMRNTVLNASLYLTDDGLGQISWRVESDVKVNDGYAGGWISNGRHSVDDLYVGERFIYSVLLADEMIDHLDGNCSNAHLCSLDDSGDEFRFIEFGELKKSVSVEDSHVFEAQCLCHQPGSGVIALVDDNGELLTLLEPFNIQKPLLRATETIPDEDDDKIEADVQQLMVPINSEGPYFYLYLVDKEGYNLNTSSGCGFETSLFDFAVETGVTDEFLNKTLDFKVLTAEGYDDGRVATFYARCVNDGSDKKVNESLIKYVTKIGECDFNIRETNYDLKGSYAFSLDYLPIILSLVDNGWAGYADCQLSVVVDNPSLLPMNVSCWQLNRAGSSYNGVTRNEILELYGQEFASECYNYVCEDFSPGGMPFYCSGTTFYADAEGAYPMPELSTSVIYHALLYDYWGQTALLHQIDAVFDGGEPIYKLKVENNLSNASLEYRYLYGSDGWNDRGIWLYTSGHLLSKPNVDLDQVEGLSPVGLNTLSEISGSHITVAYDSATQNLCALVNSAYLSGVQLNAEIVINASGYVQTTPNGTWGKKVDNYCTAKVSKLVEGSALSTTFTPVDGNAIKEAMNAIYSQTFSDSYNLIGSSDSYQHSAHPTSLDVSLRFSLGDDGRFALIPIESVLPKNVTFHHAQENVSYSVPINTVNKVNVLSIVDNLRN